MRILQSSARTPKTKMLDIEMRGPMDAILRLYLQWRSYRPPLPKYHRISLFNCSRSLGGAYARRKLRDHQGADSRITELVMNVDAHVGELQHQCFKLECLGTLTCGLPPNGPSLDLASSACAFCCPTGKETTSGNAAALRPARTARREVFGNFPEVL